MAGTVSLISVLVVGDAAGLFRFERVAVRFGATTVLADIDVTIPDGGVTAMVGPSGAGKSTMLRLCNRLIVPTGGTVYFRGADVAALDPLALRRQVGMVFQRPTLFDGTVLENLRVADPAITVDAAATALHHVGLDPVLLDRAARDLSGGEGQRACLARTLATHPSVLLMDEPTAMLDLENAHRLERLVRRLVATDGVAVVWVSHDAAQIRRVADWVIRLDGGRVTGCDRGTEEGCR
jgi:putative ABC transport system ATP-binding protein